MRFLSDNTATACPEVIEAITAVNHGRVKAYGDDEWSKRLDRVLGEYFGREVKAFAVVTGTAANSLSIATLSPPYGAVFAHGDAHIVTDECGAPEFFSGGARLVIVGGPNGKVAPDAFEAAIGSTPAPVHKVQPAALSITQATELGTTYRPEEVAALTEIAHRRNLKVHMDGARFANAVAFLGCSPGDITWRAGVDVLSFGATKNGALAAEAVVFFDPLLVRDFELRRKRAGHLISKSRFVTTQLLSYVESGAWKRNAIRANALAQRIAAAAGAVLLYPVEANELFLQLGDAPKRALREAGFEFYDWGGEKSGAVRLVVSWDQPEQDVDALCRALSRT
ncbi:MAG: beta-eliminating lyase-related protein [Gammaproteobacteria bacterium]